MAAFDTILVANRGEIALRILKTAKAEGYRTVAVYSDADSNAPYVSFADTSVCIGPAQPSKSYLCIEAIIHAALSTGANAVHPGYGFLSENPEFARACRAAGLTFIGPSSEAIEIMGNKAQAKRHMLLADVPCVPGYQDADQSDAALIRAADNIGYPVMVKAASGGGGRGMREVHRAADLPAALETARTEARNAFGSDELILEKAIQSPRHVEIQIFADASGDIVHFGERDCSVQRRHQKIIEEAPCPAMTQALRDRMGRAAVDAARSISYMGAGTVEFLLDDAEKFYFLEMNTRLQVEHPVTELVTGLDLVALQISIAQGQPLPLTQDDLVLTGHAIEARLYAEDTANSFLPTTGEVELWQPIEAEGIRVDSGVATGSNISAHYDPMIAKIMAWGPDRDTARRRLIAALEGTRVFGATTNKSFLSHLLAQPGFASGAATTSFVADVLAAPQTQIVRPTLEDAMIAALLQFERAREQAMAASLGINPELANFGSSGHLESCFRYATQAGPLQVHVKTQGIGYQIRCADRIISATIKGKSSIDHHLQFDGQSLTVAALHGPEGQIELDYAGQSVVLHNGLSSTSVDQAADGGGYVVAPMHGNVLHVFVSTGEQVAKGDRLAVLEAMKMQHDILAEGDGRIEAIWVTHGTQIAAGDRMFLIKACED